MGDSEEQGRTANARLLMPDALIVKAIVPQGIEEEADVDQGGRHTKPARWET